MNSVQKYCAETGESENGVLNELQARGAISDLCESAAAVAEADGCQVWRIFWPGREFALSRRNEWVTRPFRSGRFYFPGLYRPPAEKAKSAITD